MYSKVYLINYKSLDAAKMAVSHLSEEFGGAISQSNIASLKMMLHKDGKLTLIVRFDTLEELNAFTPKGRIIIEKMKLVFHQMDYVESTAVAVFLFEREATTVF